MKRSESIVKLAVGPEDKVWRFGAFRLQPSQRKLLLGNAPVPLGSRAFDLLVALAARKGAVATKDELMAEVWPGTIVEENNLAVQVSTLRKILSADPSLLGSLQAVPGRGYCFATRIESQFAAEIGPDPSRAVDALSIVVLPFDNLSSDVEQGFFARGVSDAITADLSRISELLVITSASAAAIDGHRSDVRQLSAALGVRYVLMGNVQRSGGDTRVGAQLVDGYSGALVWSEIFSGTVANIFALQDEITGRIAVSIGRKIFTSAAPSDSAHNSNQKASDLVFRGIAADNRPQSLDCLEEQERLFRSAIDLDGSNGDAQARLARAILLQSLQAHAPSERRLDLLRRGAEAAERAVVLSPDNARAHLAMSYLHMLRGDFERCARSSKQAIALDRNLAMAHNMLATALAHLGEGRRAVGAAEIALKLDPAGPQFDVFITTLGLSHLISENIDVAVECFLRAQAVNPLLARAHAWTGIALATSGDTEAAKQAARELLRLAPGYRLSQTVDGCFQTSNLSYRQFYERIVYPNANLAGVPI